MVESSSIEVIESKLRNGNSGITLLKGSSGKIKKSDIYENSEENVYIEGVGTMAYLLECKIHNGENIGVDICNGAEGKIEECEVFKNKKDNINISGLETNTHIFKTRIYKGKEAGIAIFSAKGVIENCEVFENQIVNIGVFGRDSSPHISNCIIRNGLGIISINGANPIIENCTFYSSSEPQKQIKVFL